jgi:hypothetical protein
VVSSIAEILHKQTLAIGAGLAVFAIATEPCWAMDFQPFGFVPATPGTTEVQEYYEFETRNEYNNTITGTAKDHTGQTSQIGIARYLYYGEFKDTPFVLNWLQFFGTEYNPKINGVSLGSASGAEDLILSGWLWPISKPQQKTWVSISDWIKVPSGTYSSKRAVNLGANRWQNDIQVDYTQGLTNKFTVDFSGSWIAYGPNNNVGVDNLQLTQTPSYNVYTRFSYDITDVVRRAAPSLGPASLSAGYFGKFGGVEKLEGVRNGNETHEQQLLWTYAQFVAPKWQVLLSVNRDVSVSGQFKDNFGLTFRLTRVF